MRHWLPLLLLVALGLCAPAPVTADPGEGSVHGGREGPGEPQLRPGPPPPRAAPRERVMDHSREWMVRWGLVPVTALFLVFAWLGIRRLRRSRGFWLALLFSVGLGAAVLSPVLGDLSGRILFMGDVYTDPVDSVSLVASIGDSLSRASDVTNRYLYPEGTSWLVTGPSWLGYLVPAGIAAIWDPVVGHNLGVGLAVMLLALCSWALARSLGAGPFTALFAAGGAALAPVLLDEVAAASLDRLTLFLVPLFFLCLHKAARERSWYWPVAAGVTLAAAFYGQVYYGLYLAAASPLLVIPRLIGPDFRERFVRFLMVGAVAIAVLSPGLRILMKGTEGTRNAMTTHSLRETSDDLLHPFDPAVADARLAHLVPQDGPPPPDTPDERLLAAMTQSISLRDLVYPSHIVAAGSFYWLLALLSLLLAVSTRRGAVAVATTDTLILLVFALGPFLRVHETSSFIPLPYYLDFLWIPGFERLKAVKRFALMAAAISPVPLAIGLEGAFRRIKERPIPLWRLAEIPVVALALVISVTVLLPEINFLRWPVRVESPGGGDALQLKARLNWPEARAFPAPLALRGLAPGPALILPLKVPLDVEVAVHAMQAGLALVNEPPFEVTGKQRYPMWIESNRILNDLALASGSTRARRTQLGGSDDLHLRSLKDHGLRYVVVYRSKFPEPDAISRTEEVLDTWFDRREDDGAVGVWELRGAEPVD